MRSATLAVRAEDVGAAGGDSTGLALSLAAGGALLISLLALAFVYKVVRRTRRAKGGERRETISSHVALSVDASFSQGAELALPPLVTPPAGAAGSTGGELAVQQPLAQPPFPLVASP